MWLCGVGWWGGGVPNVLFERRLAEDHGDAVLDLAEPEVVVAEARGERVVVGFFGLLLEVLLLDRLEV